MRRSSLAALVVAVALAAAPSGAWCAAAGAAAAGAAAAETSAAPAVVEPVTPASVVATPSASLSDYRRRVSEARRVMAEALPRISDRSVAGHVVVQLILLLPAGERVRVGDRLVLADHGGLRAQILKLDVTRSPDTRIEVGEGILSYLTSLEAAISVPGAGEVPQDPAALRRLLARAHVSAGSPWVQKLADWFDRLVQVIRDWLARAGASPASGPGARIAWIAFMALLVGLGLWGLIALARAFLRSVAVKAGGVGADAPLVPVVAAEAELPADALAFADELAASRRFRDAVRALFGGAARGLADAGILYRTRTRTNAELLAELDPDSAVLGPMRSLTDAFEVAWYGHVEPDEAGYAAARDKYGDVADLSRRAGAADAAPDADARGPEE